MNWNITITIDAGIVSELHADHSPDQIVEAIAEVIDQPELEEVDSTTFFLDLPNLTEDDDPKDLVADINDRLHRHFEPLSDSFITVHSDVS